MTQRPAPPVPQVALSSEELLAVATDLCAHLAESNRFDRVVAAVRQLVPCDAVALLRLDGDALVPVAASGLTTDVLGRRFALKEHPRLALIVAGDGPVRVRDHSMADPFDGMLASDPAALQRVHACMGVALRVGGKVAGVLTIDALQPHALDALDDARLCLLAALAAAAMHTGQLIGELERSYAKRGQVAQAMSRDARERAGAEFLGTSPEALQVRADVALVAGSDLPVLISGETGVGKEVAARAVHQQSARRDQPLLVVNCAALPDQVAESELFGHTRGAFTGATDARPGRFEVADGGTLLLDEVGELPLAVQAKLLRVLQFGEIQRLGADRPTRVDVRVLAATNRNLASEVQAGRFRADLYHRLAVFPLEIPPLRQRRADIDVLTGWFADRVRVRLGLGPVRLTLAARQALHGYDWPGNVRELEHVLLRAAVRSARGARGEAVVLDWPDLDLPAPLAASLPADVVALQVGPRQLRPLVDQFERTLIEQALSQGAGSYAAAARQLGVDRGNLYRAAKRLGLTPASAGSRAAGVRY